MSDHASSDQSTIHSEQSLSFTIPSTDNPVNCYKNQLIISKANNNFKKTTIIFGKKMRHNINYNDDNYLFEELKQATTTKLLTQFIVIC